VSWEAVSQQLQHLPDYLSGHLLLTMLALILGVVICIPLGSLITRIRPLQTPVLTIAGILQTIPGIALLALMVPILGTIGFWPALIALTIYSFMPILRNTVTGILGVDPAVTEAARGMGMTDRQMLFRVELPLALPVIIAGIRTATVWVVGTATLATPVGATSLGNYIFSGLQTQNITAIIIGCVFAAILAIVLDQLVHLIEIASSRRSIKIGVVSSTILIILFLVGILPSAIAKSANQARQNIIIGSKPFTEQYILAQLMSDIVDQEGFTSDNRSGMGSIILFNALKDNSVDCYVDYSGTIWTNVMKRTDIPPRKKLLEEMTVWLKKEDNILCMGALGFENSYGLAVKRSFAEEHDLKTIADLAKIAPRLTIGSDYEFFSRPEWQSLKEKYDLRFKSLLSFDPSLMYQAIDRDQVQVISAYSTDGRITSYNLVVLSDPLQAIPPYDAVLLLSPRSSNNKMLIQSLDPLLGTINDEMMRQANKIVDVDGLAVDSAANYLMNQIIK
jgi:osmoprotectant transport system permease protein